MNTSGHAPMHLLFVS